jgi:hypothetical protein
MSKHAPGPWELTHTEQMGFRVSDSTGWGVAVVLKDTNDEANARLIAAAPQMLEALEKIAEIGRQKGDARPQDAVSCFLIAEEAIKAAKGEV